MVTLPDILKKEHVLIAVNGYSTSHEILRAIILYKELYRTGLKPFFYVHGKKAPYLDLLLKSENIKVQDKLVLESPFIIEIKNSAANIRSIKVDKIGDKLKLLLLPKKGLLKQEAINIVGTNLPYSHIVAFGTPTYLDNLFEGISYGYISIPKEYALKEYENFSLEDFSELISKMHYEENSPLFSRFLDLDTYNEFIEFFLRGKGNIDLLKVREALVNDVLSWGREDYVKALSNWQQVGRFIVGEIRIDPEQFVPSMPMWADFVYLAEKKLAMPVVTFIRMQNYVYTRIVSPVELPEALTSFGIWVKGNISEGVVEVDSLEAYKAQVLKELEKMELPSVRFVKSELDISKVLNVSAPVVELLDKKDDEKRSLEAQDAKEENLETSQSNIVWEEEEVGGGRTEVETKPSGDNDLSEALREELFTDEPVIDLEGASELSADSESKVKESGQVDVPSSHEPPQLADVIRSVTGKTSHLKKEEKSMPTETTTNHVNQNSGKIEGTDSGENSSFGSKDNKEDAESSGENSSMPVSDEKSEGKGESGELDLRALAEKIKQTLDL